MENIQILVVDDASRMRKLVKDFLVREGYAVLEAAGKKTVPLGFQACVALLVASLVLLIAAAVNLFSGM